jgi:hypothetical protein
MDGAELQRFHFLPVLVQLAVRVDVDPDASFGAFLGELLEVLGAFAFWGFVSYDMAELDDDRLLRNRAERERRCEQRDNESGKFHDALHGHANARP